MALISGSYLPSKCGLWVASICVASMWLVRLRRLEGLPVHWRPCLASRWPPSMALTRFLILWLPCVFFLAAHERQLWSMPALRLPCLVFQMHRLCGFILSLLISIDTCAYALLSWYALRGEALRPPPAPPHPLFFLTGSPCYLLFFCFLMSIIVYLGLCVFEHALAWQEKKTPLRCHGKEVIGGAGD